MENPKLIDSPRFMNGSTDGPSSNITLRDIFAMQAMNGMVDILIEAAQSGGGVERVEQMVDAISARSYDVADAMLAAREKK